MQLGWIQGFTSADMLVNDLSSHYEQFYFVFHLEIAGGCPGDGDGLFASWLKHSLAGLNAEAALQRFCDVPQEVNILEGEEIELRQMFKLHPSDKGTFPSRSLDSKRFIKMHQIAQNEKCGLVSCLIFLCEYCLLDDIIVPSYWEGWSWCSPPAADARQVWWPLRCRWPAWSPEQWPTSP